MWWSWVDHHAGDDYEGDQPDHTGYEDGAVDVEKQLPLQQWGIDMHCHGGEIPAVAGGRCLAEGGKEAYAALGVQGVDPLCSIGG